MQASLVPHISLATPSLFLSEPVDALLEFCERNIVGSTISRIKSGGQILVQYDKDDTSKAVCTTVSSDGCYNGQVECSEEFIQVLNSLARQAPKLTIQSCVCTNALQLHPTKHKFLTVGFDNIPLTKVNGFVLGS